MARDYWRAMRNESYRRGPYSDAMRCHLWLLVDPTAPADSLPQYLVWRKIRHTPQAKAWLADYLMNAKKEQENDY